MAKKAGDLINFISYNNIIAKELYKKNRKKLINISFEKPDDFKHCSAKCLSISSSLSATFELAYWTVWLSRMAKYYQEKSLKRTENSNKYMDEKNKLYKLKNKSLELLASSPYALISFYLPESPDKFNIHLYFIEIKSQEIPEIYFSFHLPYPLGCNVFPNPVDLKKVNHIEQDGMFRFGRSLKDNEKDIYTPTFVINNLTKAINKYNFVLKK